MVVATPQAGLSTRPLKALSRSGDLVCITISMEERLNVCISDLEAEACRTVQDALDTVRLKVLQAA